MKIKKLKENQISQSSILSTTTTARNTKIQLLNDKNALTITSFILYNKNNEKIQNISYNKKAMIKQKKFNSHQIIIK